MQQPTRQEALNCQRACRVSKTPLKLEYRRQQLSTHPDQEFAQLISNGIERGFKLGFQGTHLKSKGGNMLSTRSHPDVVSDYIAAELALGRIAEAGPGEAAKEFGVHTSTFEQYFQQGLAPSTQRTYGSAQERYLAFCSFHHFPPIPSSELLLCHFVTHLAVSGLRASSIKCYLSTSRQLHIAWGAGDLGIGNVAKLQQVLKGIKSAQAKGGDKIQHRLPMRLPPTEWLYLGKQTHVPTPPSLLAGNYMYAFSVFCTLGRYAPQGRRQSTEVLI